ncbi:Hypothetical predicted protein, partial [Paramuricea clavata]
PPYSEIHPVITSEYLESVVLNTDLVLIGGDFNIHVQCDDDNDAIKLLELFESVGPDQHVHIPTHCSGHILNLMSPDKLIRSSLHLLELTVCFLITCQYSVNYNWTEFHELTQKFRIAMSRP